MSPLPNVIRLPDRRGYTLCIQHSLVKLSTTVSFNKAEVVRIVRKDSLRTVSCSAMDDSLMITNRHNRPTFELALGVVSNNQEGPLWAK
jgi:hypothetical protein